MSVVCVCACVYESVCTTSCRALKAAHSGVPVVCRSCVSKCE